MRLVETGQPIKGRMQVPPEKSSNAETGAPGRALIAIASADKREAPAVFRAAPFLAQLIASNDKHPQLRERRRATPAEATAAYKAAARLGQ